MGGGGAEGEGGGGEPGAGGEEQGQGQAPARPVRLPDLMHVTQTASVVSFEDSSGTVLQEITTLGAAEDTLMHSPGAQVVSGAWKGEKLVIERTGRRGMKVTETITLEDKGGLLVIRTKMESTGNMPAREMKRVYRRVTG
jgi:hypothetical protein